MKKTTMSLTRKKMKNVPAQASSIRCSAAACTYRQTGVRYAAASSFMMIAGWALLFRSAFTSVEAPWYIFAAAGSALCWLLIFAAKRGHGAAAAAVVFTAAVLTGAVFYSRTAGGIMLLANDFLSFLTTKTGRIYLDFDADVGGALLAASLLWILLCLFAAKSAADSDLLPVALPLVASVFGAAYGFFDSGAGESLLISAMLLIMIRRVQLKADSATAEKGFVFHITAVVLAAALMCCAISSALPESGVLRTAAERYDSFRYGSETDSMPHGRLSGLGAWRKSDAGALKLEASEYCKLYLRGFTGEVYTGTSWEALDTEALAEYEALFYWLHRDGFYAQSMISEADSAAGNVTEIPEPVKMTIENIGAYRKYAYFPYAVRYNELLDSRLIGDSIVRGEQKEEAEYIPGGLPEWYSVQRLLAATQNSPDTAGYLRYERSYKDFVYKNYLQLTPESISTLKRYLDTDKKERTLAEIRKEIFGFLSDSLKYDENTGAASGASDFLTYVLDIEHKGYSVQYATATVLALRYFGVPARYQEGYLLTKEAAAGLTEGGAITLDENHAHAWAEYYLDGMGWIPFEVTPGYVDEDEFETGWESSGGGQAYNSNELIYTQEDKPDRFDEISGPRSLIELPRPVLLTAVVCACLLILAVLVAVSAVRRRRLRKALDRMRAAEPGEAIAMQFGYAVMLLRRAGLGEPPAESREAELNREAMFSDHVMTEEQKVFMQAFTDEVLGRCKAVWGVFRRFKYRFIECIVL